MVSAQSSGNDVVAPPLPAVPTLQSIEQSVRQQSFTSVQLRRFRVGQGNVVSVRERLQVSANGTLDPLYALDFLGVEGEPPGSPLTRQWQGFYSQQSRQLRGLGSFGLRNLAGATANYTLHDFGPSVRAGRAARRMVVFPNAVDKALWIIDVDTQTHTILYWAEFNTQLHLLNELEVSAFVGTSQPIVIGASGTAPAQFRDFAAARAYMGQPPELVDPIVSVVAEYTLDKVEVQNDPLNGQWKMTATYTDGIDQFVVVQAPGTQDFLNTLPIKASGKNANVIGRYRDPAMTVLVFWEGGVSFHVAGRGSLQRLDDVAQRIYVQAINSH